MKNFVTKSPYLEKDGVIFPNIPENENIIKGDFPKWFDLKIPGWLPIKENYSEKDMGKLLSLNITYKCPCDLNCPFCFIGKYKKKEEEESIKKVKRILIQGKELGLETIKLIGEGEPTQSKYFFEIIEFANSLGIKVLVFTKGHIIGSEEKVKYYHKEFLLGENGEEPKSYCSAMAEKLVKLNVTCLFSLMSFIKEKQNIFVAKQGSYNYYEKRNNALEVLYKAGAIEKKLLAILPIPVTFKNMDEVTYIQEWAFRRGIPTIITPTMTVGENENLEKLRAFTPSKKIISALYKKVHNIVREYNFDTKNIIRNGYSSYGVVPPCSEFRDSMMISPDGTVKSCPSAHNILGDINKQDLSEIWKNSLNYKNSISGYKQFGCPPKDIGGTEFGNKNKELGSIPQNIYFEKNYK